MKNRQIIFQRSRIVVSEDFDGFVQTSLKIKAG